MNFEELKLAASLLYESTIDSSSEYPDSKDKLFVGNKDYWHLNACIDSFSRVGAYASGYLDAAKLLARIVIFSGRHMDTLVYPIAYLYRHYLEITLKDLIRSGAYITDTVIDKKLEKILSTSHNLMTLWNKFKPFFEEISGRNNDFKNVKKGMESYINQIHEIDPASFAFRYDRSTDGETRTLENVKLINILNFCKNMEKLTNLFEGVAYEFDAARDHVNDMKSHSCDY